MREPVRFSGGVGTKSAQMPDDFHQHRLDLLRLDAMHTPPQPMFLLGVGVVRRHFSHCARSNTRLNLRHRADQMRVS
jgi:hypothetical protein